MIKKLILPLLILALCFSLFGCMSASAEGTEPLEFYEFLGRRYPENAPIASFVGLTDADVDKAVEILGKMPGLIKLSLGNDKDNPLSWDSISRIHQAAPQAVIDYGFTLYGRDFNLSDESMDIKWIQIDDEGALVKQITACMNNLTYLDMDSCGVSNEAMADIRDSLPNAEVVWRIWFGDYYTARTNVTKILASMPGKAGELIHDNVMDLKYCTKVKYLDLGHNNYLDTIEFIRYMPDLEVLITGMTFVEDYSPVADCPKLEYVEAMTSRLHDLTPFAELKNLRHLNICYNFAVRDISPLYGLTELERLYIGWHCPVDPAQVEEMRRLAPNCIVNNTTKDPTEEEWRFAFGGYHPRYELLRQQFGYEEWDFAYIWNDPLYYYGW